MDISRSEFIVLIRSVISVHPDWVDTCVMAMNDGIQQHLQKLQRSNQELDRALLSALSLLDAKRVDDKTRDLAMQFIRSGLLRGHVHDSEFCRRLSPIEKKFLEETEHLSIQKLVD